jgi:predicted dithiol-disulfide oxidoreductase (DUF899 family)
VTAHPTGPREEWRAARLELLKAEKALTRQMDEVTKQRLALPWVAVEKEYRFDTDAGEATLAELFGGRSQLVMYHFMFGPEYSSGGCPSCSAIADGFDGFVPHLVNHDVAFTAVSLAPLDQLQAFKRRQGWTFPWASSHDSDFNYDFNVSLTEEQMREGGVEYNYATYGSRDYEPAPDSPVGRMAEITGTDIPGYLRQAPGMSAFARQDGVVYHTYSTYARGVDGLWGMYQWLDRAPLGRNEDTVPFPWYRWRSDY